MGVRILCNRIVSIPPAPYLLRFGNSRVMESQNNLYTGNSLFTASAYSNRSGGRGRGFWMKDNCQRSRGTGSGFSGNDKIDALGRLLFVAPSADFNSFSTSTRSVLYFALPDPRKSHQLCDS